ncbi:hypothetical protein PSTT_12507 [Puccinia striiformis]|uniref:Uncharacterized protein n=1 Tax=Puccinia striiformis TaxID=27350 RepID=A0A2S4UVR2_9BASI|nr:hypothetical protein PSTT_12507 [Puccinia striiformis]
MHQETKKIEKGMGFLSSKFNMAEELQEGRMAADGSYVASAKDPNGVHDNWLEGVNSKKAIESARQAKQLRDQQHGQVEKEESMSSLRTRNDKRGLQEQQRNESKQTKKLSTQKKTSNGIEDSIMIDTESTQKNDDNLEQKHESISRRTRNQLKTEEEIKLDKRIEEITDLSSMLMGTHEELDIYDMSHGSIMGILKSEGLVPREWIPPTSVTAPSSFSSLGPTEPSQIFDQFIQQQQQPGSFNQQENSPVYGPFDKNRAWLIDSQELEFQLPNVADIRLTVHSTSPTGRPDIILVPGLFGSRNSKTSRLFGSRLPEYENIEIIFYPGDSGRRNSECTSVYDQHLLMILSIIN